MHSLCIFPDQIFLSLVLFPCLSKLNAQSSNDSFLVNQFAFELKNLGLQPDFGVGIGMIIFLKIHPGGSKVHSMLKHHIAKVR